MPDLNRSQTFADGDLVTAQKLKDLIDLTTIQPYFLTSKSYLFQDTLNATADRLLAYKASTNSFMQITMSDLVKGVLPLNGLKYWEYEGGSEYGKTFLYSRSPTSDVYCGWLLDCGGGDSGRTISDAKWGTIKIPTSSFGLTLVNQQNYEGQVFQFNAGGTISRTCDLTAAGSFLFKARRDVTNGYNQWAVEFDSLVTGGSGTASYSEYKITKTFDKHATTGYQDSSLGHGEVKAISIRQKAVDGKSTDTVEVAVLDELTTPVVNATTVDSVNYKKSGSIVRFPLKYGAKSYTSGSDTSMVGVTDTLWASPNVWSDYFVNVNLDTVASGGNVIWTSDSQISIPADQVYVYKFRIFNQNASIANAGCLYDYRLRLKAKTVGAATYTKKDLYVCRGVVANSEVPFGLTESFSVVLRRSDFPAGSEDVTRYLEINLNEVNVSMTVGKFKIDVECTVWNKADFDADTAAIL